MTTKVSKSEDPMNVWSTVERAISNWEIGERNLNDNTITLYGGDGRTIAYVTPQPFYDKTHNQAHYALLMCAAPKLLNALKTLLKEFNQHVPENTDCVNIRLAADAARIAIREAEGKE